MLRRSFGLAAALSLLAARCLAQNNEQANSGLSFNFSNPGARSLALGGAFTALADDATAAYANPAGLIQLDEMEVSVEGRFVAREISFPDRGHAFGAPTGSGLDTVAGLRDGAKDEESFGPSFVSFVLPRETWAVALFAHELADFEIGSNSQGPFFGEGAETLRVPPARTQHELSIRSVGASGTARLGDVSLGLSLAHHTLDLRSRSIMYGTSGGPFGPADFSRAGHGHAQDGDDGDVAATLGLLWRIDRRWAVGAVYRQGPDFEAEASNLDGAGRAVQSFETRFHVPDVVGLGVSFQPTDAVRVTLDYDLVRYSELVKDLSVTELHVEVGETGIASPDDYHVDDAAEFHVGVEYLFLWKRPLAIRFGAWNDPDHRIRYEGPVAIERVLFRAGDDELHVAGGVGLSLGRVKLDAGVDVSESTRTASVSLVVGF